MVICILLIIVGGNKWMGVVSVVLGVVEEELEGRKKSYKYVAKDGRWNNMLNLLRFFLISNLTASAVVVMFEKSTGFFGLRSWPDYAFFVVVILWGLAALFFMYPPEGGFGGDRAESVAGSMVDSSVANEIDSERFSSNTMLCIKLFVSGLPAFLTCIIVSTAT